jgi:membrane protein required for colicin V production
MPFTLLDGILVFVMLVSALLAMIRGFTREVFSIASWVAAAAATYLLWKDVLPYTQRYIAEKNIALGVTIAGIFFITLLIVSLITMRISDFVLDSRAGPLDRTLGFVFGAARGLILVVIAFLFLNFFIPAEKQPPWIANAASRPWLKGLGDDLYSHLPDDPEGTIMAKLRGQKGNQATQPAPAGAATPENGSDEDAETPPDDADAPAQSQPGYATDDKNQLERQIETPPAD